MGGSRDKGINYPDIYFRGFKYLNVKAQFFAKNDTGSILKINKNLKYARFYDSLRIFNGAYLAVKKFENLNQKGQFQPKFIWYAKNVGIIKKEMFDSTIWKLKSYHINN